MKSYLTMNETRCSDCGALNGTECQKDNSCSCSRVNPSHGYSEGAGFKYVVQEVFPYGAKIGEPKEDSFYVCYNEIKKPEDES